MTIVTKSNSSTVFIKNEDIASIELKTPAGSKPQIFTIKGKDEEVLFELKFQKRIDPKMVDKFNADLPPLMARLAKRESDGDEVAILAYESGYINRIQIFADKIAFVKFWKSSSNDNVVDAQELRKKWEKDESNAHLDDIMELVPWYTRPFAKASCKVMDMFTK